MNPFDPEDAVDPTIPARSNDTGDRSDLQDDDALDAAWEDDDDDELTDDEDDGGAPANDQGVQGDRPRRERARDPRADKAHDFLGVVLGEMGMDVTVKRRRPREDSSPDEINLEIVGRDVGRVIGKKGQVLSALQYLVNRVTNRPGLSRRHVVLDAEGYRYRRESSLASMALRLGEQAAKEGKIITFEPMSPRDRRVVHLALAKLPNVVTKSDGEGDERRVRIIPVRR